MGYTYEGKQPITPAERRANEELLRDIAAIAPEQPDKPQRDGLTAVQWGLLIVMAGLLLAALAVFMGWPL